MRKRHIHPIHVHGLSKSGNLRCFLPHYNSHPPKPEPCIFLYAPFTKEYFYRSSPRTMMKNVANLDVNNVYECIFLSI